MYWDLDNFSHDIVDPWRYLFLIFTPRGHGVTKITC